MCIRDRFISVLNIPENQSIPIRIAILSNGSPSEEARKEMCIRDRVEAAHEKGKAVHVWTVNSKTEIEQMKLLGVDNIITDYPVRARDCLLYTSGCR